MKLNINKSIKNNQSWRHHYIPKFYIKNFSFESNLLWVYDKEKDQIGTKQKSPKQIFFIPNDNTTNIDEVIEDDFIENLYNIYETNITKRYSDMHLDIDEIINDEELHVKINFLIVLLLWRIPAYRTIQESYISQNYEFLKIDASKKFKSVWTALDSKSKYKYLKVEAVNRILNSKIIANGKYMYFGFKEYSKSCFLLTDNPILINNHPGYKFEVSEPIIFPLSDRKLYIRSDVKKFSFKDEMIIDYNLLAIHQAKYYVACQNKNTLESYVKQYRILKDSFDRIAADKIMNMFNELREN